MESEPQKDIQMRFKEKTESIKVGDLLRYTTEDGGYFINQAGFRIDKLPVGARIKTSGFVLGTGVDMPECIGIVKEKNGKMIFDMESKFDPKSYRESNFWGGDGIEILSLPE